MSRQRLIDANALQQHYADMQNYEQCAANFPDHRGEPSTNWYCVEDALENAPTIDAIPVEWLRKWPKSLREGAYVRDIILDRQKEQEDGKDAADRR